MDVRNAITVCLLCLAIAVPITAATSEGLGAVIKEDCIGYDQPNETVIAFKLKAGTFCGFFDFKKMTWNEPKKENGFVQILFFANNAEGKEQKAWVKEQYLALFPFDGPKQRGGWSGFHYFVSPVSGMGGVKMSWREGFLSAAKKKCGELSIAPATEAIIEKVKPSK